MFIKFLSLFLMAVKVFSDPDLIQKAKAGDSDAFRQLVEQNYDFVFNIAYKWCHSQADAEDITQDVFVKLANTIQQFRQVSQFQTWLYRLTLNTAKDFFKKSQNYRKKLTAFSEHQIDQKSHQRVNKDIQQQLLRIIDQLSEKYKQTALLVFMEGMNHQEAATILNCAETTVSWRVFQLRKKFKKIMEHGGV